MGRIIDISGLDKKTQQAIKRILKPTFVSLDGLDAGLRHQIEDIFEADMTMPLDDAVHLVRSYLNEKKKVQSLGNRKS